MRETTFMILTALAERPAHGYGIIREVASLSGGEVKLRTSTLYAALDRLSAEALIEVDREETASGRLRRYYRLTSDGHAKLVTAAKAQRAQADTALRRLGGVPGTAAT